MDNLAGTGIKNIDTSQAIAPLRLAAPLIRQWLIENDSLVYELSAIEDVLVNWLELSIEELATEALYHCLSGDTSQTIGRRTFKDLLDRKPYTELQPATDIDQDHAA
ncbi:hypothetical protein [Adonisia turfae]|uniref:Uncharacterized protein n=1 Tax=Adonisia turfae CCMR0081 TaxID=2292702 RepID=A0A6M0REL9_9CYAN|nr:hypothetical protein [Adonisia turfae]NEZ54313.1 hypothetical protein [Adonisia turfae CCMR0081]